MADEETKESRPSPPATAMPSPPLSPGKKGTLFEGLNLHGGVTPQPSDDQTPRLSNTQRRMPAPEVGSLLPGAPSLDEDPGEYSDVLPTAASAGEVAPTSPSVNKNADEPSAEAEQEPAIQNAPVTDKLLGLLGSPLAQNQRAVVEQRADASDVQAPPLGGEGGHVDTSAADDVNSGSEGEEETKEDEATAEGPVQETRSSFTATLYGWFGGGATEERTAKEDAAAEETTENEDAETPAPAKAEEVIDTPHVEDTTTSDEQEATESPWQEAAPATAQPSDAAWDKEEHAPEPSPKKELDEGDKKALDEAFQHIEELKARPKPRGMGEVHPDTPVPNSDVALRLLRKFAGRTRPKIISTYGGSKARSFFSYLFGSGKEDPVFVAYRELMDIIYDEDEDRDMKEDSERIVDSVLGETGDSMARARLAIAAFVYLFSMWGHASSTFLDDQHRKGQEAFSELLSAVLDAAAQLVAHGCLDGVLIGIGDGPAREYQRAVHMLAQSVFNSDLTIERNELAAMKFLLTTGCRVLPNGDALLRGSHLLQTIRTLYHVYLTTESPPNKITARAALQQLVMSVFTRVIQSDADGIFEKTEDNFPSENHRDAFLVLRSICKLSMRNLPDPKTGRHSHIGLQTSGSNDMWDGGKSEVMKNGSERGEPSEHGEAPAEHAHLVYTAAIHPALESKLLALELILYVLQNTHFTREFIQRSGPQFHAATRNYLCVSLLKNCTSDDTRVVNLSLRIFVPLVRNFRTILKNEIEAFVTNVFFVILDSENTPAEHKSIVVKTFDEICSDPSTLAEIFLNYDCDLSAVDLFHRIVNTLSRVSRTGLQEPKSAGMGFMGGPSAARMEKFRSENRELRLDAMRALRQVLASLHASIVEPMSMTSDLQPMETTDVEIQSESGSDLNASIDSDSDGKQSLVEIYGSKKKRKAEESEVILRFNQKPSAGIAYAAKCGHLDSTEPTEVARYLLKNKDSFEKTQIGEYLGREAEYQNGFSLKVLHAYVGLLDFENLLFDEAIRYFLSGFRLPGEAQKIDRIMEKFAERYTDQNPDVFPTADAAFILAFSIIMLNTDLHNPAIKEDRRMTKEGFLRNNRGICEGQDLPDELLTAIFDRIKENPISLKEDDEARERVGRAKGSSTIGLPAALSPASFFGSHYDEMDRARESNYQKERDHIIRTTESLLRRRRHHHESHGKTPAKSRAGKPSRPASRFVRTEDSGLRDEYVSPMFEVAWGPSLAAFSTAMESANGTVGALISIASDDELELAAENAAETIEVCLTGFRFAICTAGLVGNETARDAFMLGLSRFSQLGTGVLLEPRHIRCIQTMLSLARDDGELLGDSWEHVFFSLSEINRFHQLFHLMARNDRAAAAAAQRRQRKVEEKDRKRREREQRRAAAEDGESVSDFPEDDLVSEADDSLAESDLFSDDSEFGFDEDMDARAIDEANARVVYDAVSETLIEAIYERSSSFSPQAVKDFVTQLCLVSKSEISVRGDQQGDLTHVTYRQKHQLLGDASTSSHGTGDQFHHSQPNIYNLQKLVEVTHYNMESRPRLIFADLWAIVADHLTTTALHSSPAIAMYAVDSFRQLSIQYLQRDELEVFEFQKRFLKPLEVVMGKSSQSSTKELLMNCVDRIIQVFQTDEKSKGSSQKGGLKSGWLPILTILGLGGRERDEAIVRMGFKILSGEIKSCLSGSDHPDVLLSEYFVETVNALLMYIRGAYEEVSLEAIDRLVDLSGYLGDPSVPTPQLRRKSTVSAVPTSGAEGKQELELWWPILLGLSGSVGDARLAVRTKSLKKLTEIIGKHFLPPEGSKKRKVSNDDVQTFQLIFRGVLFPIVESGELGAEGSSTPPLPEDFTRFLTEKKDAAATESEVVDETEPSSWMETTFDPFVDSCVSLCLRAVEGFRDEALIDEVFAVLNACLISDSGVLAIRGLHRLEQLVTLDLDSDLLSDDVWATISHILRRCLSVRGLPQEPNTDGGGDSESMKNKEYEESVQEFIAEDKILPDRRYIASNAVMAIGQFLNSERLAVALRWRLFLINGLGRGIIDWERAAALAPPTTTKTATSRIPPPSYMETALYGRKWMNRFLLQLVSIKGVAQAPADADGKTNKFAAGQSLVVSETQRLLAAYLKSENTASQYHHSEADEIIHKHLSGLVTELLSGYGKLDDDYIKDIAWLNSVLLGSCIQSRNEEIRLAVQKLVQRTEPPQQPYPAPPQPKPDEEDDAVDPPAAGPTLSGESVEQNENTDAGDGVKDANASADAEGRPKAPERTGSDDSWNPLFWLGSGEQKQSATETKTEAGDEEGENRDGESPETTCEETAAEGDEKEAVPTAESPDYIDKPEAARSASETWNPMSWFGGGSAPVTEEASAVEKDETTEAGDDEYDSKPQLEVEASESETGDQDFHILEEGAEDARQTSIVMATSLDEDDIVAVDSADDDAPKPADQVIVD